MKAVMSNSTSPVTAPATDSGRPWFCPTQWLLPHLTPYHITVAVGLGIATAGFGALTAVLIIIATNFNVLGWIE